MFLYVSFLLRLCSFTQTRHHGSGSLRKNLRRRVRGKDVDESNNRESKDTTTRRDKGLRRRSGQDADRDLVRRRVGTSVNGPLRSEFLDLSCIG